MFHIWEGFLLQCWLTINPWQIYLLQMCEHDFILSLEHVDLLCLVFPIELAWEDPAPEAAWGKRSAATLGLGLPFYSTQVVTPWKETHIFLLYGALFTVVCIRDSRSSTDDTAALVGAIVTLITDAHQGAGPHIGITDNTFAITWGKEQIKLSSWPLTGL